jgi:hypothetical protein
LEHAKKRLSKWAARLFDPNRIRGLVEPPMVIPLNDEFLKAFGKREKADGTRLVEIIHTTIDSDDDDDDEAQVRTPKKSSAAKTPTGAGGKVKITNLAFRTSGATLQQACEKFGPLVKVHLILDKDRQGGPTVLNSGRAYVTFEDAASAEQCVASLKELDGRPLRLSLAMDTPRKAATGGAAGASAMKNRYYGKDISTVCYRCGQVGHIEPNCTNPAKARPCPLCALTDHDMKACPSNRICFNCGCPGHVNRECSQPRGMYPRKRMICSICFQSGHHRLQCRSNGINKQLEAAAICMVCGDRGHILCQPLTWFYDLQGISCFNCGAQGHSGYDCQRPTLYQCVQDPDLTHQEIERAEANSL